jgi:alpha-tubulin suppressor-like RCC1 family protein
MTRHQGRAIVALLAGAILPACGVSGGGTLIPTVAPAVPAAVTAASGNKQVTIRWTSPSTGSTFVVKRSLTSGGPYFPVTGGRFPTPTSYVDSGLDNGTTYFYVVSAFNQFGSSSDSLEVQSTPGFKPLSVASGPSADHSLAILPDRSLWSWGINNKGQLGNGSSSGVIGTPVEVLDLQDVTAAAAGESFSVALRSDGTVWAWGANDQGQLGMTGPWATTPQIVPDLTDVVALAAGQTHVLAVRNDGSVWSWGGNASGQLGNRGSGGWYPTPMLIPGIPPVKAIAAGAQHCLAVGRNGTVWAWGGDNYGQLGQGSVGNGPAPLQVPNLTSFDSVAVGGSHSLALRSDGTVWAWGSNADGQIGNGIVSATNVLQPVQVPNLTEMTSVAAGFGHSFALRGDGSVWSWGNCVWSQLGNGSTSGNFPNPGKVLNVENIVAIASGLGHGLALEQNGTLRAWGLNNAGEVGDDTSITHDLPIPVPNLTDVLGIAASSESTTVVRGDGTVWAWGTNSHGQVGIGGLSFTTIVSPGQVPGISGVKAVAVGALHTLALKTDGTVWAWGYNQSSQLGQGAVSADVPSPLKVTIPATITAVAAGRVSSYALDTNGFVWQWGDPDWDPTTPLIVSPTQVPVLTGIIAIAAGWSHALALKNDGTVWTWGSNNAAQLGRGPASVAPVSTPDQVTGLSGAVGIAGGNGSSFAVRSDGSLWGWGGVSLDGGPATISPPGAVLGLANVVQVTAGNQFALVRLGDGSVWSWGANDRGQLGTGDEIAQLAFVPSLVVSGAAGVSAGDTHSIALLSDGTLLGWGMNQEGELGVPMLTFVPVPVIVAP